MGHGGLGSSISSKCRHDGLVWDGGWCRSVIRVIRSHWAYFDVAGVIRRACGEALPRRELFQLAVKRVGLQNIYTKKTCGIGTAIVSEVCIVCGLHAFTLVCVVWEPPRERQIPLRRRSRQMNFPSELTR